MHVENLMSRDLRTCPLEGTLNDAAREMWTHDVGSLPVVDERGHVQGMITDRDVAMAAFLSGGRLSSLPVAASMSREVYACRLGDSIQDAEALMVRHQVRRLPVLDDAGTLVGVLSLSDLARAARGLRRYAASGLVRTLAAVSQPRQALETAAGSA